MWSMLASTALAMPTHDVPLRVGQPSPDDVAVVVGIEDYAFLPDVPYAERDARAFHDLLVYTLGVPTDRVQLLDTNGSKERIEAAIEEAAERVGSEGTLWVYFAGHGAASPSTGERVLLGIDTMADAQSFDVRSLPVARIEDLAPKGARTVLVVDACYAGAGRAGAELLPGQRFAVPTYARPAASTFVEWTAAQPHELSGPLDEARHGAFTWAVVGALRGWADGQLTGEADGTITFDEADLYVQEVLRSVDVRDQHPALRVTDRQAVLATLPVDKLEARPEAAALRAEVHGDPGTTGGSQAVPRPATHVPDRGDGVATPPATTGGVAGEGGMPGEDGDPPEGAGSSDSETSISSFMTAGMYMPKAERARIVREALEARAVFLESADVAAARRQLEALPDGPTRLQAIADFSGWGPNQPSKADAREAYGKASWRDSAGRYGTTWFGSSPTDPGLYGIGIGFRAHVVELQALPGVVELLQSAGQSKVPIGLFGLSEAEVVRLLGAPPYEPRDRGAYTTLEYNTPAARVTIYLTRKGGEVHTVKVNYPE